MGIGFAKVCMPIVAASLIVWLGWRQTWMVFGLAAVVLGIGSVLAIIRRSPEEMGLLPDGVREADRFRRYFRKATQTGLRSDSGPKFGLDPRRSDADADLLVAGDYFRHCQYGGHGAESARLPLCHRPRSSAGHRRHRDERHRLHAARFASAVGTYGRAHGRSDCGDAQIRYPSYRFRIGHFNDKSFLSLRGILSVWHWS